MSIPHFIYSFISLFISYFILSIILFYLFFHKLDIGDILWLYEQYGCKHLCCRFFYRHRFSVFFGMYLGMEWLGHMITLSNIFRNCHNIFQSSCTISHPHHFTPPTISHPHHFTPPPFHTPTSHMLVFQHGYCLFFALFFLCF